MNTHDSDIELPTLPEPFTYTRPGKSEGALFHAGHIQDYARAAIEADRQRRGEPVACSECGGNGAGGDHEDDCALYTAPQPAEPDYKQLFEQMCERCDALDAKLAEYSEREPVGYIMPTALKQLKAGGNAIVGGVSQGCDVAVYLVPQPAEPVKAAEISLTGNTEN